MDVKRGDAVEADVCSPMCSFKWFICSLKLILYQKKKKGLKSENRCCCFSWCHCVRARYDDNFKCAAVSVIIGSTFIWCQPLLLICCCCCRRWHIYGVVTTTENRQYSSASSDSVALIDTQKHTALLICLIWFDTFVRTQRFNRL